MRLLIIDNGLTYSTYARTCSRKIIDLFQYDYLIQIMYFYVLFYSACFDVTNIKFLDKKEKYTEFVSVTECSVTNL